jgi:hypothetical protein
MKNSLCMLIFGLALIWVGIPLWAVTPLPEELVNAKKIYLVNQTSDIKQFDTLRDALVAWRRWEVVTSKDDADLILTFFMESTTSSQTMQSCNACPPSQVVSEKEIHKVTIAGKDGTVYLAAHKEKNNRYSAETQAQWLLEPIKKRLEPKNKK